MATTTQDELYRTFLDVSGQQAAALAGVSVNLAGILTQVQEVAGDAAGKKAATPMAVPGAAVADVMTLSDVLAQVHEMQAAAPAPNVKTPTATSAYPSQGNSGSDVLSSLASTVLKGGFGLAPMISGLIGLFGGSDTPAPAPLIKYALPAAVNYQAAETTSGVSGLDYDQSGMPRTYREGASSVAQTTSRTASNSATASGDSTRPAPQITVNVQAMDARSFMDRSNEIALAVRDAMLNMNAINDVVNEL